MPLSNEKLMKPRWKVIADYPKSLYNVGDILNGNWMSEDCIYCDTEGPRWRHYPHLFKPLQWWEEREIIDLPEYVKVNSEYTSLFFGNIHKVKEWFADANGDYLCNVESRDDIYKFKPFIFLPSTEAEYLTYKTQS